jgi:hypothetical protein
MYPNVVASDIELCLSDLDVGCVSRARRMVRTCDRYGTPNVRMYTLNEQGLVSCLLVGGYNKVDPGIGMLSEDEGNVMIRRPRRERPNPQ